MVMQDREDLLLSKSLAGRELSAFVTAVTELFGSEEAEVSANDWLGELSARDRMPGSTREWRTLTISAAARLAWRVYADRRIDNG